MKITKEAKIGISAIVVIIMVYWGINLLKGLNIFEGKKTYYMSINDASDIEVSTAILMRGVRVGSVTKVKMEGVNSGILVEMIINSDYDLPKDSYAKLSVGAIMSAPTLQLIPGVSNIVYNSGDTIPFKVGVSMMQTIDILSEKLALIMDKLDTTLIGVNTVLSESNINNISESLHNFTEASKDAASIIAKQEITLSRIMSNLDKITTDFNEATPEIKQILSNLKSTTGSLDSYIPILIRDVNETLNKINSEDGTMGKLINNKDVYNNLDASLINLATLINDIKQNPGKYVKVSMFEKLSPLEKEKRRKEKILIKKAKNKE